MGWKTMFFGEFWTTKKDGNTWSTNWLNVHVILNISTKMIKKSYFSKSLKSEGVKNYVFVFFLPKLHFQKFKIWGWVEKLLFVVFNQKKTDGNTWSTNWFNMCCRLKYIINKNDKEKLLLKKFKIWGGWKNCLFFYQSYFFKS